MPLSATTAAYALNLFIGRAEPEPLVLRLYAGPRPNRDGKYRECSGGGYRCVPLLAVRWRVSEDSPKAVYPEVVFTLGPMEEAARGWCITGEHSGAVRHYEAFDEPVQPEFEGAELTINIRLDWIREA